MNYETVFAHRVAIDALTGCHNWLGTKVGKGYGQASVLGRRCRAHRAAYELAHGEFPPEMHVLHRCDNPACVNPEHLFLGTNADNVADKMLKGRHRAAKGENVGVSKLTDAQARAILIDARPQVEIARAYGVSKGTVSMLMARKTWRHL